MERTLKPERFGTCLARLVLEQVNRVAGMVPEQVVGL